MNFFKRIWAWIKKEEELTVAAITGEFQSIVDKLKAAELRALTKIHKTEEEIKAKAASLVGHKKEATEANTLAAKFAELTPKAS